MLSINIQASRGKTMNFRVLGFSDELEQINFSIDPQTADELNNMMKTINLYQRLESRNQGQIKLDGKLGEMGMAGDGAFPIQHSDYVKAYKFIAETLAGHLKGAIDDSKLPQALKSEYLDQTIKAITSRFESEGQGLGMGISILTMSGMEDGRSYFSLDNIRSRTDKDRNLESSLIRVNNFVDASIQQLNKALDKSPYQG